MNKDAENLKHFITIFKSMSAMESAYIELEEFDVPYDFSKFFHDFRQLDELIERTVNISSLTKDKLEKYKKLKIDIFERLKWDYPYLCQISGGIGDVFYEAYKEAEKTIEKNLEPYEDKERPMFLCGFSSFNLYIHESSFLGLVLKEMIDIEEYFTYKNGYLDIKSGNFTKKFNLTSQEYQIYSSAYQACMDVLNKRLNLNGTVSYSID